MATNPIVFINDVKTRKRNTSVRVRVANMWRKKMNGAENKIYRLDMILMDEMGDFIYANCMHTMLERFDSMLHLDETFYINNPVITKDNIKQHVDFDKKLSFNDKTTIIKCQNWEGPKFAFDFLSFKILNQKILKHNTKTDFIGYVKVCYNLDYVDKKNGMKAPKINFKLRNLDGIEIDGSLWEDKAVELSSFMSNPNRDPHVFLLVQFAAVKNRQGKMSVTNNYEGSRVFINEDIEEISAFKKRYLEKFVNKESSNSSNSTVGSYMISDVEDQFLNNYRFIITPFVSTIRMDTKVIIVGKITEIPTNFQWYYKGCNYCKSKVEKKLVSYEKRYLRVAGKEVFKCTSPQCEGAEVKEVIRYRITLKVNDGCGSIMMTLFDYEACKVFGKPARYFVQQEEEMINNNEVPSAYPKKFNEILGKKYAFLINVTPYNIYNPNSHYGIIMLTKEEGLLDSICKKWNVEEVQGRFLVNGPAVDEVADINEHVVAQHEEVNQQDTIFSTNGDASEMSTMNTNFYADDVGSSKLPVDDAYEVGATATSSINKRKNVNAKEDGTMNKKINLFIPNLDK